jgi:hypothetical protein
MLITTKGWHLLGFESKNLNPKLTLQIEMLANIE